MSSRLLTMKFMQRAAASSASSSPTGKDPSTPNHHHNNDDDAASSPRPSKRARTSLDSNYSNSPHTPRENAQLQTALAAEEARKAEALARVAAEKGETKWALSVAPGAVKRGEGRGVVVVGGLSLGDIERMDSVEEGRRRFGAVRKKAEEKREDGEGSEGSSSEDEEIDVEGLIEKGRKEAARSERKGTSRDGKLSGSRDGGGGRHSRQGSLRGKKRKSAG